MKASMLLRLFTTLLALCVYTSYASVGDSLFATSKNDKWMAAHTAKRGETIFSIAKQYHVPPAILADENSTDFQKGIAPNTIVYVPLGAFNKATATTPTTARRPVYYRIRENDNLYRISKNINEPQRLIQEWNQMPDNSVAVGQVLIVTWILFDANEEKLFTDQSKPATPSVAAAPKPTDVLQNAKGQKYTLQMKERKETQSDGSIATIITKDTVWTDTLGAFGKTYMQQTANEKYIIEEKGTAVFYETPGKLRSRYGADAKSSVIYAFHNTARRGTIIRVYNPGTDKYVFVKVMGPLPDSKLYHNSLIGIGDDAKDILGVLEGKAWVELKYNSR
ncbi:hypothetical protein CAP35_11835 [Chitinophagaceae bacterium IBVUCB1]|nr:hypothetical protein CAP35_11835 [Chitinophagaceae bacterium IBVUCB1]